MVAPMASSACRWLFYQPEEPTIITELLTEKEANSIADEANTICVEPDIELSGASVKKAKIKRVHKKVKKNQAQWNMQMLNADKKVGTIKKKDAIKRSLMH